MQEHIRRAHPEHYISKLPATEESFLLMINTPPTERAPAAQPPSGPSPHQNKGYLHDNAFHRDTSSAPGTPRNPEDYVTSGAGGGSLLPAANAAAALAQLHNHSMDPDWDSEAVSEPRPGKRGARRCLSYTWADPRVANRIGIRTRRGGGGRDPRLSSPRFI